MVSSLIKDLIGGIGGAILAFCLLPQLWKMYRTRSAEDLSMPFIVLYTVGEEITSSLTFRICFNCNDMFMLDTPAGADRQPLFY